MAVQSPQTRFLGETVVGRDQIPDGVAQEQLNLANRAGVETVLTTRRGLEYVQVTDPDGDLRSEDEQTVYAQGVPVLAKGIWLFVSLASSGLVTCFKNLVFRSGRREPLPIPPVPPPAGDRMAWLLALSEPRAVIRVDLQTGDQTRFEIPTVFESTVNGWLIKTRENDAYFCVWEESSTGDPAGILGIVRADGETMEIVEWNPQAQGFTNANRTLLYVAATTAGEFLAFAEQDGALGKAAHVWQGTALPDLETTSSTAASVLPAGGRNADFYNMSLALPGGDILLARFPGGEPFQLTLSKLSAGDGVTEAWEITLPEEPIAAFHFAPPILGLLPGGKAALALGTRGLVIVNLSDGSYEEIPCADAPIEGFAGSYQMLITTSGGEIVVWNNTDNGEVFHPYITVIDSTGALLREFDIQTYDWGVGLGEPSAFFLSGDERTLWLLRQFGGAPDPERAQLIGIDISTGATVAVYEMEQPAPWGLRAYPDSDGQQFRRLAT